MGIVLSGYHYTQYIQCTIKKFNNKELLHGKDFIVVLIKNQFLLGVSNLFSVVSFSTNFKKGEIIGPSCFLRWDYTFHEEIKKGQIGDEIEISLL